MLLKFFRVFVDRHHYGKDKNLLFSLPEAKGIPRGKRIYRGYAL